MSALNHMHFKIWGTMLCVALIVQSTFSQERTKLRINKSAPIITAKLREEPPPKFMIVNYSRIQTTTTNTSNGNTTESKLTYQDLDAYLKFPVYVKKNIQVVGGIEYGLKNIEVGDLKSNEVSVLSSLQNKDFHRFGGELLLKYNVNDKNYLYAFSAATLNYDQLRSNWQRQLNSLLSVLHGYRYSPDTDIGYGVGLVYASGRYVPFPVLLYSHYFGSRIKLTMLIPNNLELRYTSSPKNHFYALVKPSGMSYLVNESMSKNYNQLIFNKSDVQISLSVEHELYKWVWFRTRVGYNIPVNYSFSTNSSTMTSYDKIGLDVSSFGFATLTLFCVVPKTILKKAKGR